MALPVFISMIIGLIIILSGNSFIVPSRAHKLVESEKALIQKEISELKTEQSSLENESKNYDDTLKENKDLLEEINSFKSDLSEYEADIEEAKAKITELDAEITSKKAHLDSIDEIEPEKQGKSIQLSPGEYKCPNDIKAGRYSFEGTGKIYLYSIANTLSKEINLSTTDTHSFKLIITSGESIKIEGSKVKLTPILDE